MPKSCGTAVAGHRPSHPFSKVTSKTIKTRKTPSCGRILFDQLYEAFFSMRWMPSGSQSEWLSKTVFLCHNQSIESIWIHWAISNREFFALRFSGCERQTSRHLPTGDASESWWFQVACRSGKRGQVFTLSTSFISWLSDYPGTFSIGINNWSDDFQNCFLFWNLAISQFAWFFRVRVRGGRHSGHQALVPSLHSFSFIPFVPFVHPPFHQVSFPFGWYFRLFAVLATSLCDMGLKFFNMYFFHFTGIFSTMQCSVRCTWMYEIM